MQLLNNLEAEAERLFPMPLKPCGWVKARILWKRERWVKEQTKGSK